jgi:hypothetical protein
MSGGPIREMEYSRRAVRGADYLVGTSGTGTAVLLLHGFPRRITAGVTSYPRFQSGTVSW